MKQTLIALGLTLCACLPLAAQKVYKVGHSYEADVKVYVVKNAYDADLVVYEVDKEYKAKGNTGLWWFAPKSYKADKKIYFTPTRSQADLKIYFTNHAYKAGWKNYAKKHLLY